MPYNIELEKMIDRQAYELGISDKKKMFGGIAYMIRGNLAFGIHKEWLIIRTSPEKAETLLKQNSAKVFDITGRPMKGWLMISPENLKTDDQLLAILNLSIDYVNLLPEK
jgi:hypothetical protein